MKSAHILPLTSLRGIAAWVVVLHHFQEVMTSGPASVLTFFQQGYLAVDLFFVLSGYVICANYQSLFPRLSIRSWADFMARRMARIYPLHLIILLLYLANPAAIVLFSQMGTPGPRYEPGYYFASLVLVQNWGFMTDLAWNVPAWSISTEMAAYLMFPLLLLGIRRSVQGVGPQVMLLLGLAVAIGVAYSSKGYTSLGANIQGMGLLRCVLEFSIGMVLALLQPQLVPRASLQAGLLMLALLLFAGGVLAGLPNPWWAPGAFACLILAVVLRPEASPVWVNHRLLLHLGEISYSTYLAHYLVRDWVKFASASFGWLQLLLYVLLVYAASLFLYRMVELPGREASMRWWSSRTHWRQSHA